MEDNAEKSRLDKARVRVSKLKGFYTHLMVYLLINTALLVLKIAGNSYYGENFMGPLWHFSTFATWLFWGIGLFFHGLKVFSKDASFVKNWEERQIQKYMERDKEDVKKYK